MTVTVVLPALDEADALADAMTGRPAGLDVVVVDNGSTDGTGPLAARLGARVVTEPRRGFGSACRAGVAATDADVVAFMDADGSCAWADLLRVAGEVADGRADLALGWRRADLRRPGAMPWHVAAANAALGRACGLAAGVRLRDVGPLRAIRREALLSLGMRDATYGWPLEMVLRSGQAGLRVVEVPVAYHPRAGGRSKVTGRPWPTIKTAARMGAVLARHAATARRERHALRGTEARA